MYSNVRTTPGSAYRRLPDNHINKGFATLLRNPNGIMVRDSPILSHNVFEHLQALPSMSTSTMQQLLDPADKQNVPKAVHLLQLLLSLDSKQATLPTSPSQTHRWRMLVFVMKTLGHFLLPFISTTYTLSRQLHSLATYAHLAAAMWIRHGSSIMTGALYANSQAIVCNIFITTLRLQAVDPNLPFHIILEGTDHLETLFADCRTQDHSRNFDILQLCEKLSMSVLINGIYEQNPDLDRSHRQLNLTDAMGIDRVNPRSWKGDVTVGHAKVVAEWMAGQADANKMLISVFGKEACVNFESLFTSKSHDLLRLKGHYVGIRHTADNDRTESPEGTHTETSQQDTNDNLNEDECNDIPIGVDLDDLLPERVTLGQPLPDESPLLREETCFMEITGKCYFKSSVVTAFLMSNHGKKVPMRTLWNQGVILEDLCSAQADQYNAVDGSGAQNPVCSGDIAATLITIQEDVCLAVVEIRRFEKGCEDVRRLPQYRKRRARTDRRTCQCACSGSQACPEGWQRQEQYGLGMDRSIHSLWSEGRKYMCITAAAHLHNPRPPFTPSRLTHCGNPTC